MRSPNVTGLVFCAASLVASTGQATDCCTERKPGRFGVFLAPTVLSLSRASSDVVLAIPDDWRGRLEPPSPDMRVTAERNLAATAALLAGLSLEPTLRLRPGAELAALISYDDLWSGGTHGGVWLGSNVSGVTAHWWNPVTIAALRLRKPHPNIGVGVGGTRWRLAAKFHRYEILEQQFEGVDCPGCVNGSRLSEERLRERGWGQRYSVAWQPRCGRLRLETSYERNGKQLSRLALAFGLRFRVIN